MARDYPPGPRVHRVNCPGFLTTGLPVMSTADIARTHPNGTMHNCFHFKQNPEGVVEVVAYPEHKYLPRAGEPFPGATRAFCRVCGGTHGTEQIEGGNLLMPDQARRIILPGETAGGEPGRLILPGDR